MAARSPRSGQITLVAIIGPTASGKSDLAMKVAKEFNGEIIAADSRTVYKGMDIGTAKPTNADQAAVKHWGLDLVEPGERFTAAMFKSYAEAAIDHIQSRSKLPIIVGGTGLYIDSLLFDFSFQQAHDEALRQKLNMLSIPDLQALIQEKGYEIPENSQNKRHLVRTLERQGRPVSKSGLKPTVLLVGLLPPDSELRQRIDRRAAAMFDAGVVNETRKLAKKYGSDKLLKTAGIVYKICLDLLDGQIDQKRAIELFKTADWQYARRQRTWFKRNPRIKWFDNPQSAYEFIRGELSSKAS